MRAGLLELALTIRIWFSLVAPKPIPLKETVWIPASSLMVRSAIGARVGGAFTKFTVKRKLALALAPPLSVTVRVMTALPTWLLAGVTLTVRLEALPPRTMFELTTSAGLDELPAKVRLAAAVSASPTVNESGPV